VSKLKPVVKKGRYKNQELKLQLSKMFDVDINDVNELSFVNKYYVFGFKTLNIEQFEEELLGSIDWIYKTRNYLAHGTELSKTPLIKKNAIKACDYSYLLNDLLNESIEVYNRFFDLERP